MAKELFEVILVDELPTKGDNHHLYLLKGEGDDPTWTVNYYDSSWKSFDFDITDVLKGFTGYAATGTKTLKVVDGVFTWA